MPLPNAADIRAGVVIDGVTGTLVVPNRLFVVDGVVFDNGTVGAYAPGDGVSISLADSNITITVED